MFTCSESKVWHENNKHQFPESGFPGDKKKGKRNQGVAYGGFRDTGLYPFTYGFTFKNVNLKQVWRGLLRSDKAWMKCLGYIFVYSLLPFGTIS